MVWWMIVHKILFKMQLYNTSIISWTSLKRITTIYLQQSSFCFFFQACYWLFNKKNTCTRNVLVDSLVSKQGHLTIGQHCNKWKGAILCRLKCSKWRNQKHPIWQGCIRNCHSINDLNMEYEIVLVNISGGLILTFCNGGTMVPWCHNKNEKDRSYGENILQST